MKLQNIILSGVCKYEKSVKGMEERRSNLRPLTKPPGYRSTKLENFIVDKKQYQAIVNTFDFNIYDSDGNFKDKIDEVITGMVDLVCKQYFLNIFLLSSLGLTEEVGAHNNTIDKKQQLQGYISTLKSYNFPIFSDDPKTFSDDFIRALKRVPIGYITNPHFPLFLHETYNCGLFYNQTQTKPVQDISTGTIINIKNPSPFRIQPVAGTHRPNLLYEHPTAYLSSFYNLKGKMDSARTAFKAIIIALKDRFEESSPFILQSGYIFEAQTYNPNILKVHLKISTTPAHACDPYWDHFARPNSSIFDLIIDAPPLERITQTSEIIDDTNPENDTN